MAVEGVQWGLHTIDAGEDLSGEDSGDRSYQDRFLKLASSGKVELFDTLTDRPIGVLQNRPKSDMPATVSLGGVMRVRAGGAIVIGDPIGSDTTGRAIKQTTTGNWAVGVALEAGAEHQMVKVLINNAYKV